MLMTLDAPTSSALEAVVREPPTQAAGRDASSAASDPFSLLLATASGELAGAVAADPAAVDGKQEVERRAASDKIDSSEDPSLFPGAPLLLIPQLARDALTLPATPVSSFEAQSAVTTTAATAEGPRTRPSPGGELVASLGRRDAIETIERITTLASTAPSRPQTGLQNTSARFDAPPHSSAASTEKEARLAQLAANFSAASKANPGNPQANADGNPLLSFRDVGETLSKSSAAMAAVATDTSLAQNEREPSDPLTSPLQIGPSSLDPSSSAPSHRATIETPVGAPGFTAAVADKLGQLILVKNEHAELHLHPSETGPIDVRINVVADQATLSITAPHAATRDALEQALPQLRDALAQQGITLGQATVQSEGQRREALQREARSPRADVKAAMIAPIATSASPPALRIDRLVDVFA